MGATHGCICCEHPDHARRFTERPCEKCFPEDDVKDGLTPLMRAAVRGHDKCADIVTHAGANVNKIHTVSWFYDFSALIYAANGGQDRCVNSLIQAGTDVNYSHKTNRYLTPLLTAAYAGNFRCMQLLLKAGANVNQKYPPNYKVMPFVYKNRNKRLKCAMLLFAAGQILEPVGTCDPFRSATQLQVYKYLKETEDRLSLKHICRESIRKHLINIDGYANLFLRIPKVGLPRMLSNFLLYNMSLEEERQEEPKKEEEDTISLH